MRIHPGHRLPRALPLLLLILATAIGSDRSAAEDRLRVGVFDIDASPPIGSPLAYDPNLEVTDPLSLRGVVLIGRGEPVVLCAVDWIGIANDGHRVFRERLAAAAGTSPQRVAVHALHQHDAPRCDFSAAELAAQYGVHEEAFDSIFAREVLRRAAEAVRQAVQDAQPVTHLGLGIGEVEKVASNRRILGPDGRVQHVRYTATADPKIRAFPEGVIDPQLRMISLWDGDEARAVLTYYATHPQSYYRTGQANPDFPGMARNAREEETGVAHIHFNGAGGNIGAGKYNDGAHENRQVLADRVAAGMRQAWERTERQPFAAADLDWNTVAVALPPAGHLEEASLQAELEDESLPAAARVAAATRLVWLRRCLRGDRIDIPCLTLGPARVLHLPGELFVEYQLAAQQLRPDLFVAMAAYGDYGTGYIGTEIAYQQGGYETSERATKVAPEVEGVLMEAIRTLLEAPQGGPERLGVEAHRREQQAAQEAAALAEGTPE